MMKSSRGFTLIELLLVISLMGLATGLVAPKLFSTYRKIQVQSEIKEISNLLDAISYRAFIQNRPITVFLDREKLQVDGKTFYKANHVRFDETKLTFIQSGFCLQDRILYQIEDKKRALFLKTL